MPLLNFSRPQTIAILFLAVLLVIFGFYTLTPAKRLKARQEALIEWARSGAPSDFGKDFASSSYEDQWGHTPAEVAERVRAARFAYRNLTIEEQPPELTLSGRTGTVVQGISAHLGDGESRQFTLHCTWERESIWPWSWKLRKVEAPDLRF
ncbi:MAG TPA: hypothetical protein VG796_17035 [Verrucomicrobiales bacterium]|jgi:hypothetical protein|nr:hypothetical protein [Verrucomicrobiales bacterium]